MSEADDQIQRRLDRMTRFNQRGRPLPSLDELFEPRKRSGWDAVRDEGEPFRFPVPDVIDEYIENETARFLFDEWEED